MKKIFCLFNNFSDIKNVEKNLKQENYNTENIFIITKDNFNELEDSAQEYENSIRQGKILFYFPITDETEDQIIDILEFNNGKKISIN